MQRSHYLFVWSHLLVATLSALFTNAAIAAGYEEQPSLVNNNLLITTDLPGFAPTPKNSDLTSRHCTVLIADAILGPVGKIDPSRSVQLTLINETPDALTVGESGHVQYQVAAGSNLVITLASFPVNLFFSPTPVNISTAYRVNIDGNAITVQVLHLDSDAPGDRSISIARDGTVSVY